MSFRDQIPDKIVDCWRSCTMTTSNFRAYLQTPEWFAYRWAPFSQVKYFGVLSSCQNEPIAVTPLVKQLLTLPFSVSGRTFAEIKLNSVVIVGNLPLLPEDFGHYAELIKGILAMDGVDCVSMTGVPTSTSFWRFLAQLNRSDAGLRAYIPSGGSHRYFYLEISGSYEEYLKRFKSKTIYNLRRNIRMLEKATGKKVELRRMSAEPEVEELLRLSLQVTAKAWQRILLGMSLDDNADRHGLLCGLARRAMLRGYVLTAEDQPIAIAISIVVNKVQYLLETAYDQAWAQFSPGRSIIYLIIKDCFEADERPDTFHFGPGDYGYKELFATATGDEVSLIVVRATASNRARVLAHSAFRAAIATLKSLGRWASLRRTAKARRVVRDEG